MAPPLTEEHQRVVALNERLLATLGVTLSKEARILDFGCGSGRHTYEYLDAGYANVVGYDRHNVTALRTPDDIRHFVFSRDAGAGRVYQYARARTQSQTSIFISENGNFGPFPKFPAVSSKRSEKARWARAKI